MGQHRNVIRRIALVGAIVTALFVGLAALLASPAQASVVWGCDTAPPGEPAAPTQVDMTATFPKSDGTTGSTSLMTLPLNDVFAGSIDWKPGLDVNADGYDDYELNFQYHTGMEHFYSDSTQHGYRNTAIEGAMNHSQIFPLLKKYRDIDYETDHLAEYGPTNFGPWYLDSFSQQAFVVKLLQIGDTTLPEGAVNINVTIHSPAGATNVSVGLDSSGSSGALTPFPLATVTTIFLDGEFHELAAAGVQTYSETTTVTPWSNLAVTAGVTSMTGTPTDLAFELGYDGALASDGSTYTSVGFPGSVALVGEKDCGANPYDDILVAYDEALTGGVAPDGEILLRSREDLDKNGSFEFTATYLDAAITGLSKAFDVRLWARERDIDGDGAITATDVSDVDGDGFNDLPWNGISLEHQGEQAMGVDATFASQSMGSTADLALRFAAPTLQANPNLGFDYFGPTVVVDADEDGTGDDVDGDGLVDITTDLQQARIRFCEVNLDVDECTQGSETASEQVQVAYTNEFAPDGAGNVEIPFPALGAAPQQLVDTQVGHVDPADPQHWVRLEDTESTGARSIAGLLYGIRQGIFRSVAGDANDDLRVTLDTTNLRGVGIEGLLHDADGSETKTWAFVDDVPDVLDVTIDADGTDVDGDPILAELQGSTRTAVGFEVQSASTQAAQSHSTISGWLGTGDGSTDGLPTSVKVAAGVEPDTWVEVSNSSSLRATVGLTTSDATDRATAWDIDGDGDLEVMRTRANLSATIPDHLELFVADNMDRVEVEACGPIKWLPLCSPVSNIVGTAVHEMGDAADSALPGVSMLPIPSPKDGVFQDPAGSDFAPIPEFARYVAFDDFRWDHKGLPVKFRPWGAAFRIHQLTRLGYARSNPETLFRQTDFCAAAATAGQSLGVGVYTDSLDPGKDPMWLNGEVTHEATTPSSRSLNLQAQLDLPDEAWGELGAMAPAQLAVASSYPLLEAVQQPCPAFDGDHTNDVAPLPATGPVEQSPDLSLLLRSGSYDEVHNEIYSLEKPAVALPGPGTYGIDAALYSSRSHAAADIAGRIDMPGWLELQQPVVTTCRPEGNQDVATCIGAPLFDQEYTTTLGLQLASNGDDFGDLDAEVLVDTDDVLDGGPVMRVDARLEKIPGSFTVGGDVRERPRDGYLETNLTVRDDTSADLEPITVEVRDEKHPARLGAEGEAVAADPENEGVPNYRGYLYGLSDELTVRAKVFLPEYGADLPAYEGGVDCSPPFGGTMDDEDNVYPGGNDPGDWGPAQGPRHDEEVRPMYVHADVDMNDAARTVDLLFDARVDSTRAHRGYNSARDAAKMAYTSDAKTNVDVWALYPAVQAKVDTDSEWMSMKLGGLSSCLDIDIPIHLDLDSATRLSVGLDAVALTLTMAELERSEGARAGVSFQERVWSSDESAYKVLDGIWVAELVSYFKATNDKYATKVTDSRMGVVFAGLDPGSSDTSRNNNGLSSDLIDVWKATDTDTGGDERYMGAFALLMFHPDVVTEMHEDNGGLVKQWTKFMKALDDATDYLVDMSCDADACGTLGDEPEDKLVTGPQSRWTMPELDRDADVSQDLPAQLESPVACFGSESDDVVVSDRFGRLPDGTQLQLSMRSAGGAGEGGRAEVNLIGHYAAGGGGEGSSDDVRFVQELYDQDTAADVNSYCWQWRVTVKSLEIDWQGSIELRYEIERRRRWFLQKWGEWESFRNRTVLLDASGNMGGKSDHELDAPAIADSDFDGELEATAGVPVTFSTVDAEPTRASCSFHPGDGTRVEQSDAGSPWTSGSTTWEHTFLVPGRYAVMVFCHDLWETVGPGTEGNHEPTKGYARRLMIEVS